MDDRTADRESERRAEGGRFASSGWALLPLRLFLGFTMLYAGIIKFSDPSFLDPAAPGGIAAQMQLAVKSSPIGGFVSLLLSQTPAVGVLIALAEIAVGVSLLLGIWVRLGALGGAILSLSLLLTVSWGTTPYFFGVDIVFLFAFIPLVLAGDGGVWSVSAAIAKRFSEPSSDDAEAAADAGRRAVVTTASFGLVAGLAAVAVGAVTRSPAATTANPASPAPSSSNDGAAAGAAVARVSDVPVGSAFTVTLTDGTPAILLQPAAGTFLAYSRICTHEGCTVDFVSPDLVCPCHGAEFSAQTGDPVAGPARSPLEKLSVRVEGDTILLA